MYHLYSKPAVMELSHSAIRPAKIVEHSGHVNAVLSTQVHKSISYLYEDVLTAFIQFQVAK